MEKVLTFLFLRTNLKRNVVSPDGGSALLVDSESLRTASSLPGVEIRAMVCGGTITIFMTWPGMSHMTEQNGALAKIQEREWHSNSFHYLHDCYQCAFYLKSDSFCSMCF